MNKANNTPHDWSEDKLQAETFRWFHNKFPTLRGCYFAVPNGVNKSGHLRKLFKATGLWPGVADTLLMLNKQTYCIELKRPDGRGSQSSAQKKWEKQMRAQGFEYIILNDLLDLQNYILAKILENTTEETVDKVNYPHKQLKLL